MDAQWNFRNAYNEAKKVKDAQDAFCQKVEAEEWSSLDDQGKFPENLQWEALVDVLRRRVKVSSSFCGCVTYRLMSLALHPLLRGSHHI